MTTLTTYIIGLSAILCLFAIVYLIVLILENKQEVEQDYEDDLLIQQYELTHTPIDKSTGLTTLETTVLDTYENSNIKIPVEIIEDLRYMKLKSEDEIFSFIENQRNHWKLENNKKLFRKSVA